MAFTLKSKVIEAGGTIARKYTCDDRDVSPSLSWANQPAGTQSYLLICDDPDAPVGTWVHWVIYNIPSTRQELPEGVPTVPELEDGTLQGRNDFGRTGYGGPCPPRGKPHRYFFRLYALDTKPGLASGLRKKELLRAAEGHIIGQAEFFALYGRQ